MRSPPYYVILNVNKMSGECFLYSTKYLCHIKNYKKDMEAFTGHDNSSNVNFEKSPAKSSFRYIAQLARCSSQF